MDTQILQATQENIRIAGNALKNGLLVGLPTETVYGLAANALNPNAVANIFIAKGRPSNNPLIVHIADLEDLEKYCYVNEDALKIANAFWPGPLTILLPKKSMIPDVVNAGLDTVAIRMPSSIVARDIIRASGCPIAAPSANISGKPSPTTALHVYHDFAGKIPYIVDGGDAHVGLESTVLHMAKKPYTILRPGGITLEQIQSIFPETIVSDKIFAPVQRGEVAESPGMMYKHYAPNAKLILLKGSAHNIAKYYTMQKQIENNSSVKIICFEENANLYPENERIILGKESNLSQSAQNLFAVLRALDEQDVQTVFCETSSIQGIGMAIMNRLLRAAAFCIVDTDEQAKL